MRCAQQTLLMTCLMVCSVLLGLCGVSDAAADSLASSKPNIILIMTDDQGYGDLACHGHPYLQTPHLDKLHSQSTRFTDFQVSPTCAPTRSALMSGRAPFKNGVTHTILERERMTLKATTIAQVLKAAGYTTGIFGKWHLGDEEPYQPHNRGFDEAFIHGGGGIGQTFPGSCADAPGNKYFDPAIRHNGKFVKTTGYCTDIFFRQALGWIKTNRDKRFFAYITTNAPHGPFICPEQYSKPYKDKAKSARTAAFYGMIANIDDNIGRLVQKLDEWNLANDTLLIFMTDNGSSAGDYPAGMKGKKGSVNEGGTRVPLFLRLPGKIKAGVDVDRLARHVDLFPTLAEFAGAAVPPDVQLDGRSLLPLIENPKADWADRYTFFHQGRWGKKGAPRWERGHCDPDQDKERNFAVRNERFRLVGKDALYDIQSDPGETTNVIEQHPDVAKQMLAAYEAWWDEVRPLMVNEDVPLAPQRPYHVLYDKQKEAGGIPAWTPPRIDLPKVLIIGDSISIGYTPHVKRMLEGVAVVQHNPGNAQHTGTGLEKIDPWLGDERWDVIHFNWGLWDLCYRHPDSKVQGRRDKVHGTQFMTLDQYEKNLDKLVTRLKKTGAKLIWANTTLVPEGEAGRKLGDDLKYNEAAARVMKKHGVMINDLNALTRKFPADLFIKPGNVHFTNAGSQKLAEQVAKNIRNVIEAK